MNQTVKFFSESPGWYEKIGNIHVLIERARMSERQSKDVLRLRRLNRIMSIHASTAIEGNCLNLSQVQDVINGKSVLGPPKDIKEVQNAYEAYNGIGQYNPFSVDDLLKAHAHLTQSLIEESGKFRSVPVVVATSTREILHRGAEVAKVPGLVSQLFQWGATSEIHPLIKSAAVHYMLEHIHPFRDGNGRIGRLWHTIILSKWNSIFEWMPVETIIHHNQANYYRTLQESHRDGIDCKPFIDFMIDVIENSLYNYIDIVTETIVDPVNNHNDPVNSPNDLVNAQNDPVNSPNDLVNAQNDLVNVPNDLVNAPNDPVNAPIDLVNAPIDLVNSPNDPVNAPNDPVNTPTDPVNTPIDLVNSPNDPVNTPIDLVNDPNDPVNAPNDLVNSPNDPINTPIDLVNDPNDPVSTPNDLVNDVNDEDMIVRLIKTNPSIRYDELAEKTGRSSATVKRQIKKLKQQGRLERHGSDKSGFWFVKDLAVDGDEKL
ncbi:MAG: Fic family protein [Planctomycetaceae bacterium]|nr:Fic family protein [Planctomycetaceae bacterium]